MYNYVAQERTFPDSLSYIANRKDQFDTGRHLAVVIRLVFFLCENKREESWKETLKAFGYQKKYGLKRT